MDDGGQRELHRHLELIVGRRHGEKRFVKAREGGTLLPVSDELFWAFDELLRVGALWALHGQPGPIYIEMATANRSEDSYPHGY